MALSLEQIERLAHLARLALTPEELAASQHDLNLVLEHVAQLERLDTTHVEPTTHITTAPDRETTIHSSLREDTREQTLLPEQILGNAPDTHQGMFRVPKVVS